VRDIGNSVDILMTIGHYLGAMEKLTKQGTPTNYRDPKRQRLYLKDIDCPAAWHQHLQNVMPQILFYLNDCVGEKGGPGALHERNMYNQLVLGRGTGPAGDLMSCLPPAMQAENMMCYIGHEGTYTPAHREMCATLGQNIMVETSDTLKGERPGSSIWFMTESKDREVVSEYFLSMLGHDIEVESHFAQINAWKKAPFPVYIVEQRVGDLVLIPPLAPHQVWNRGTRTMKVAWNRTTVETLELALHEALPRARMVCRDEQYKCKAIIYYSLLKYYDLLKGVRQVEEGSWQDYTNGPIRTAPRIRQLQKDFKRLFHLYTEVLISEMFSSELPKERNVEFLPFDSNVTCSYCRCNIFNRFLTCKTCIGTIEATNEEDAYDICMECYAMGRSCSCISDLKWVEQWHWSVLTHRYEEWRGMVIASGGFTDRELMPQPLEIARQRYGKKPAAQICQEQLRKRPWRDISKLMVIEPLPGDSDEELEVDDEGRLKKRRPKGKKRRSKQGAHSRTACHVCQHQELNWKLAFCTNCTKAYCYGSLWRAFDLKPQTIMEDENWQCPKCLNICSCGKCRRDPSQRPYRPKGTLLGHDTKRVADPRSVESLVDFSRTNFTWLRGEGDGDPQGSLRMQKLMRKAQAEKARVEALEELVEDERMQQDVHSPMEATNAMVIDPILCGNVIDMSIQANLGDNSGNPKSLETHVNKIIMKSAAPDVAHQTNTNDTQHPSRHNLKRINQTHNFKDNPLSTGGDCIAPATMMQFSYPDPSSLGRDRMIGMGYYQQDNDIDKILFDHPDASTPTGQTPNFTYPRLTQEHGEHQPATKKLKGDSCNGINAKMDEAYAQFLQEQKKQKIAEAEKNGVYFMTQNKLNGGTPLVVKLCMMNSKDFLQRLKELDNGTHTRLNPRSARSSINTQRLSSEPSEDLVIVRSDVEDKFIDNSYSEEGDRGHENSVLPTQANSSAGVESGGPMKGLSQEAPISASKEKRGRGRPPKKRPQEVPAAPVPPSIAKRRRGRPPRSLATIQSVEFEKPQAVVSFISDSQESSHQSTLPNQKNTADGTAVPTEAKEIVKHKIVENVGESAFQMEPKKAVLSRGSITPEDKEIFPDGPLGITKHREYRAMEENALESVFSAIPYKVVKPGSSETLSRSTKADSILPQQHWKIVEPKRNVTFSAIPVADPATPTPSSAEDEDIDNKHFAAVSSSGGPSSDKEEGTIVVGKNYNSAKTSPYAMVSEDYQTEKLEALHIVEAESEEQERSSAQSHSQGASRIVTTKGQSTTFTETPRSATKSLPKSPLGKFLSMAERRALRGKPFKNVGAKPSLNT
jgi:JmjC domain, hydroxylase/Zinc-finger domain of monoamine-oxidase A repressor R1